MTGFDLERDFVSLNHDVIQAHIAEGRRQQGAAIRAMTVRAAKGVARISVGLVHSVRHVLHLDSNGHADPAR